MQGLAFETWALDNGDRYPMHAPATNGGSMELINGNAAWVHFVSMSNELSTPKILRCPADDEPGRQVATTFASQLPPASAPNELPFTNDCFVSYFIGLDAVRTNGQMVLAGDRSLVINGTNASHGLHLLSTNDALSWNAKLGHKNSGNILLVDGGVQQLSSSKLASNWFMAAGTNSRFVFP